jgi:hypothetical protein
MDAGNIDPTVGLEHLLDDEIDALDKLRERYEPYSSVGWTLNEFPREGSELFKYIGLLRDYWKREQYKSLGELDRYFLLNAFRGNTFRNAREVRRKVIQRIFEQSEAERERDKLKMDLAELRSQKDSSDTANAISTTTTERLEKENGRLYGKVEQAFGVVGKLRREVLQNRIDLATAQTENKRLSDVIEAKNDKVGFLEKDGQRFRITLLCTVISLVIGLGGLLAVLFRDDSPTVKIELPLGMQWPLPEITSKPLTDSAAFPESSSALSKPDTSHPYTNVGKSQDTGNVSKLK